MTVECLQCLYPDELFINIIVARQGKTSLKIIKLKILRLINNRKPKVHFGEQKYAL